MAEVLPKNILIVHANNDFYGAEKILFELLCKLDPRIFRPIVVLPEDTRHINRLSRELERCNIEYHFLRFGVLRRKYLSLWKLPRLGMEILTGAYSLVRLIRERNISLV